MEGGENNTEISANEGPLIFGEYEAVRAIGKGKFAIVYRAHKIGEEDVVALKRISVDMMNVKAREKCLKEVRLLQSLDHPNIIHYMDSFITENDLIIVYEWAAAGDLKRQLRKAIEKGTPLEERVIWKYFSQICSAMQYMHEKRIMHRDLKPANIFLTLDGTIKVGDLGLSREFSEHTYQAHSKVGTPLYMSPEVLKGDDGYDFKSDIWSLGCLLYELAMLRSPFKSEGLNLFSLFQKISNGDYQPLPDTFSQELRDLTYAMISVKPEERPEIAYVNNVAQRMRSVSGDRGSKSRKSLGSSGTQPLSQMIMNDKPSSTTGGNPFETPHQGSGYDLNNGEPDSKPPSRPTSNLSTRQEDHKDRDHEQRNNGKEQIKSTPLRSNSGIAEEKTNDNNNISNRSRTSSYNNALNPDEKQDEEHKQQQQQQDHNNPWRSRSTGKLAANLADYGVGFGGVADDNDKNNNNSNLNAQSESRIPTPTNQIFRQHSFDKQTVLNDDLLYVPSSLTVTNNTNGNGNAAPVRSNSFSSDIAHGVYRRPASGKSRPTSQSEPHHTNNTSNTSSNIRLTSASSQKDLLNKPIPSSSSATSTAAVNNNKPSKSNNNVAVVYAYGDLPANPQTDKLLQSLESTSPAFVIMDNVYEKLKLLSYPMEDHAIDQKVAHANQRGQGKLLPIHFACNLQLYLKIAGHDQQYMFRQFHRMMYVILWLSDKIGGKFSQRIHDLDLEQQNSMFLAKQLLGAVNALMKETSSNKGVISTTTITEMSEFSATSIMDGYGYGVCSILNYLTDVALQTTGFTFQNMIHCDANNESEKKNSNNNAKEEEEEEDQEIRDDDVDMVDEDADEEVNNHHNNNNNSKPSANNKANNGWGEESMSMSSIFDHRSRYQPIDEGNKIDAISWKQETEKVSALLTNKQHQIALSLQASWQTHIHNLSQYQSTNNTNNTNTNKTVPSSSSASSSLPSSSSSDSKQSILLVIQTFQKNIHSEKEHMISLERTFNNRAYSDTCREQYVRYHQNLTELQSRITNLTNDVQSLSSTMNILDESLEEVKDILDKKLKLHGGGGSGEGSEHDNPVLIINRSIQTLQDDIRQLHIQIAFSNAELWNVYKQRQYKQFIKHEQQSQEKRKKKWKQYKAKSSSTIMSLASDSAVNLDEDNYYDND